MARKNHAYDGQLAAVADIEQEIVAAEQAEYYARKNLKRHNVDEFLEKRRAEEKQQ